MKVSGSGTSKEDIVNVLVENMRGVLMDILRQEIMEEGEMSYRCFSSGINHLAAAKVNKLRAFLAHKGKAWFRIKRSCGISMVKGLAT